MKSPVYNVRAVPIEKIHANSYNPNSVAPPEMELLYKSIKEDGYTMQELNGLVYYVRTCCDRKDVLNLIEALNIEVMKIER